ncbi:urease subunit beta [Chitinophaga japonensis]|uniref:Urease subunit beta n=1 Tax=Chitinophaga japonensis TaxID=104662 RepID=A0A562SZ18_CHIJA|nr:urease subunit beta [Chitinophaga japonensis]TWI86547.1 urease subunit beta [Chitinophaga japonensis]
MIPGEYFLKQEDIIANQGRRTIEIKVVNTGDRPVQIGSHCHFFEVNRQMAFDRAAAFGMRLNVPSGNAVRFEPGEEKTVQLVELGGDKRVIGINNLANGVTTDPAVKQQALEKAQQQQFKTLYREP